jgi:hypothetical protein
VLRVRRKDGSTFPADVRLAPMEDADGCPLGLIGVSVDVTERVRTAAELRSARDHLRAVTNSMCEGSTPSTRRAAHLHEAHAGMERGGAVRSVMHDVIHGQRADGAALAEAECPILNARITHREVRVEDDVFELTETGLLRDEVSACSFIEGVDRLGSHVALDDFGTGYGSFTYVKRLPSTSSSVEDAETLEMLRGLGEGYGIGRPAPLEQVLSAR